MVRSPDCEEMLLSGASAAPTRRDQRLRARMMLRKRLTLSATAAGGLPARTRSKCCRASPSSPFRKNARASSRRTRTRSGRLFQDGAEGGEGLVPEAHRGPPGRARREQPASAVMPARKRGPMASSAPHAVADRNRASAPGRATRARNRVMALPVSPAVRERDRRPDDTWPGPAVRKKEGRRPKPPPSERVSKNRYFFRVAYSPAAAPFVNSALNAPYTPVGRAAGLGSALVSLAAPPQAVAVQAPPVALPPTVRLVLPSAAALNPPPESWGLFQFDHPARIGAVTPEVRDPAFEGRTGPERHRQVDIGVETAGGSASSHFLAIGVSHPCDRHANGITLVRG